MIDLFQTGTYLRCPDSWLPGGKVWIDRLLVSDVSECWSWAGCHDEKGYARVRLENKNGATARVHRVLYELMHGSSPRVVHHRCENKSCVNPNHLEAVTTVGHAKRHRKCQHSRSAYGRYGCLACRRERYQRNAERERARSRAWHHAHRDEVLPKMRERAKERYVSRSV